MSGAARSGPPLAKVLARGLVVIAGVVFVVNSVAVGLYYGSDRRALEAEVVADIVDRLEAGLEGRTLAEAASVRDLFTDHPEAYAYALVDRGGEVLATANAELIPPGATDLYADDWFTRLAGPDGPFLVAGHEFEERSDGLRMVFVMAEDPARLLWRAYFAEIIGHVWLPILPLALLLMGANAFLLRRGLAPVAVAAGWARDLRPGAPTPPPEARVPAEIADLVDATQRSVERVAAALEAEKRHAAEAAHALRTPVAVLTARLDALPPGETTDRLRADLAALSRTVQQVLASSRAEALTEARAIDLRLPAETVTATLAPFAYGRGIELSLDSPETPVMALADPEGVELALSNLVENAILHGGKGPVDITVGPGAVLSVRDRGPGLPEDAARSLFDPFWRGPGAAPGGAGLGLAIVARVQRAQGGTVEARNAQGGGAAFVLGWPSPDP